MISVLYFTVKWIEPLYIFKLWMEFLKFGKEKLHVHWEQVFANK